MSGNPSRTRIPADLQRTLERMYVATVALGQGDPEPFTALLRHADDVSLFGAWGPCKRGRDELTRTFRWVGTRFGGGDLHCEDTVVVVGQDLAPERPLGDVSVQEISGVVGSSWSRARKRRAPPIEIRQMAPGGVLPSPGVASAASASRLSTTQRCSGPNERS